MYLLFPFLKKLIEQIKKHKHSLLFLPKYEENACWHLGIIDLFVIRLLTKIRQITLKFAYIEFQIEYLFKDQIHMLTNFWKSFCSYFNPVFKFFFGFFFF